MIQQILMLYLILHQIHLQI